MMNAWVSSGASSTKSKRNLLALQIIREDFGLRVQLIASTLLKRGRSSTKDIKERILRYSFVIDELF